MNRRTYLALTGGPLLDWLTASADEHVDAVTTRKDANRDGDYEGEVRYQGSSTKIQSAIQDALGHSSVDSERKSQFIHICAVFPEEGIPDSVVEAWDLRDAKEELSKALHGEVIKVAAEGYTLIDVTATEGPDDIIQQLSHRPRRHQQEVPEPSDE